MVTKGDGTGRVRGAGAPDCEPGGFHVVTAERAQAQGLRS
jgi:hypothetical protein